MNETRLTPDLRLFFAPRSVALVGATEELTRFGGRCLQRMVEFGFGGRIFPVNPRFRELRGITCYPSVRELPDAPDHVGIVVPAPHVPEILEDCAARGARFATVYTGGFSETGSEEGRSLQERAAAIARESGIRLMGPNCNGLINFVDGFAMTTTATIAGPRRPAGNVAVVSQSGGVGQVNVMWRAQQLGIGISYEVSCGNCADLDLIDFAEYMVDDQWTDVILMVAEHIGDGERFMRMARRAAEREKPIVVLKFGRTEAGSRAASSHTGAVTGSDQVHDAAFRQWGVIRVDDCNELYEMAMLLRTRRWPRGTRAAATTVSGGNGVLVVDLGASLGMSWPELSGATKGRLQKILPKLGSTANPADLTNMAIGRPEVFRGCIDAIADDENVDVIIPIFTMAQSADLREAAEASRQSAKPMPLLWLGACTDDPALTPEVLASRGAPVYRNTLSCLKAVQAAMRYGKHVLRRGEEARRPAGLDLEAARGVLRAGSGLLTERASKQLLAAYGFPVTREALATSEQEAVARARRIGAGVALKIESPDIAHKTEANAIRLSVQGDDAVRAAFLDIMAAARRHKPEARLHGVLVQEMAPPGLEMILGITTDPVFGPVLVVGLGGIYVEVLRDLAYRVCPIDAREALAMLRELRAYPLLEGVRGTPARDIDVLCDLMCRLSWLGRDMAGELRELDINPLVVLEQGAGARVVDALAVRDR